MWPFTGGCHYSGDCSRYSERCGRCPLLGSRRERDISRWVWNRKTSAWAQLDLTLVCPSRWLAEKVKASSLFSGAPVQVIPNGLDTNRFRPFPKPVARNLLNLPIEGHVMLFGCADSIDDPRKGFQHFLDAAHRMSVNAPDEAIHLAVFGASALPESIRCPHPIHFLGYLGDDIALSLAYAAADVFVAPALQDNLPNTIMEAMACGTPCVAFGIGGILDMIDHQIDGYLAHPDDSQSLGRGVQWVLNGGLGRATELSTNARKKAATVFDQRVQARKYLRLCQDLSRRA